MLLVGVSVSDAGTCAGAKDMGRWLLLSSIECRAQDADHWAQGAWHRTLDTVRWTRDDMRGEWGLGSRGAGNWGLNAGHQRVVPMGKPNSEKTPFENKVGQ